MMLSQGLYVYVRRNVRYPEREKLRAGVAEEAVARFVDVDEAHAVAIDDMDRVGGRVDGGAKAQQGLITLPLIGDVAHHAAVADECAGFVEHRLAAHREPPGVAGVAAAILEVTERVAPLQQCTVGRPVGARQIQRRCVPQVATEPRVLRCRPAEERAGEIGEAQVRSCSQ